MNIDQVEEQMETEIKRWSRKGKFNPKKYVFVVPLCVYRLYCDRYSKKNYYLFLFYKEVRIFWSSRIYRDDFVALITKKDYNSLYNTCNFVKVI